NGRRNSRSPVQIPSRVLSCTSRSPSPSSSRAHSCAWWSTVAWRRPWDRSEAYGLHSSVYTAADPAVAGTPKPATSPARLARRTPFRSSRPLSRPTAPAIGTRSLSQVPWPRTLFARRRGGSSGSVCGTPFFPRILIHLVGLHGAVGQRGGAGLGGGQGAGLHRV